jgi:hypothetical protein
MEGAENGLARAGARRWASVGRSAHPHAATAGQEAAGGALRGHDDARLLLVFASGAYDIAVLARAIAEVALGVPVVGCTSAAEVGADGPEIESVIAVALGGEGLHVSMAAVADAAPRDAGARVAACVGDVAHCPHRALMLLADGPSAIHADIVRGAYSVAGAGVPLVGGVAGHPEHGHAHEHAVIYGDAALRGAVVGVAIGSEAPIGIGVRHGWEPIGEPMLVTAATGSRVLELDGRPAAAVYRERLGGGALDDAQVLAHPLGWQPRGLEAHIRSVTLSDEAVDGGFSCAMPSGSLVWIMSTSPEAVLDAAEEACAGALAPLDGAEPSVLLAFDCAARRRVLGPDFAAQEIARVIERAGGTPVAGLYTYGEIARTRGIVGLHHQTLVLLALA